MFENYKIKIWNLFDIWVDQQVKAINTRLLGGTTGTVVGTEIFSKLYSVDPTTGDFVFESESDPYLVTAADLNTALVMPLNTPGTDQLCLEKLFLA